MKILVTGASGFIGSALCQALISAGHTVRAFHRPTSLLKNLDGLPVEHALGDLTQPDSLASAVNGIDVVFHTAAHLGSSHDPSQLYAVTVEGTRFLLAAAQRAGVYRVVHTSSVAALGVPESGLSADAPIPLIDESHTWNYDPARWRSGYAKYLAENEVQKAVANGLDVVIVNPSIVFGPGDIYRAVSSILIQAVQGRIPFCSTGGWNIVHLDDVVAGHLAALEQGHCGERYILGGQNMNFEHFLDLVDQAANLEVNRPNLPPGLVRIMASLVQPAQAFIKLPIQPEQLRLMGRYFYYDISKSHRDLDLPDPQPALTAITDALNWFQKQTQP